MAANPNPRRLIWSGTAAVASIALHVLIVGSLVYGGAAAKYRLPDRQGAGASALLSAAEPVTALILIPIQDVERPPVAAIPDLSSRGFEAEPARILITSPDVTPAFKLEDASEDPEAKTVEAVGDTAGRALMFGRYLGQISARIERAWLRPRSAVEEGRNSGFSCPVGILQSAVGKVLEVTLKHCNGDLTWQMSLVRAIESASPLPAPPDPSVFVTNLTLTFESDPLIAGGNEQGFEPPQFLLAR